MYEASNYIYKLLNIKIEQLKENGILMLPFPTGVGKTYNIIKYIKNNFKTKKIFFISNQLKLLPSLEKIIEDESEKVKEEITNSYLEIPSLLDGFREYFKSSFYYELSGEFEELKELDETIQAYDECADQEYKIFFDDKFHELERKFRIKFKNKLNDPDQFLKYKKHMEKLYPASLLYEKNIIMMTTKKFFLPLDPIISSTIYLPEEEFKNSIVFIDEIDSTKGELLNLIASTHQKNFNVDCIGLFRKIYESILDINITSQLMFDNIEEFPEITDNYCEKGMQILKKLLNFQSKYQELYYQVKKPLLSDFETEESKTFIFKDKYSIVIQNETNANKYELYLSPDEQKLTNFIVKGTYESKTSELRMRYLIDNIVYAIKGFMYEILSLAHLYNEYQTKYGKTNSILHIKIKIPLKMSLNSILDRLSIGEENRVFLLESISNISKTVELDSKAYELDGKRDRRKRKYDFYYDGFSFIQLLDYEDRDLQTKVFFNMFNVTPECMLLKLISTYPVVGISATANYDTCIKNYDLQFMKYKLGNKYLELSVDEIKEFNKLYSAEKREYKVESEVTPDKNTLKSIVATFFEDATEFEDELNIVVPEEKIKDIYNIIFQFKKFIDRDAHSFMFFLNYNLKRYEEIVSFLKKWLNLIDENCAFSIIDKKNFVKDGVNIDAELFKKEKVFMISCYQTIGVGINLQYDLPTKDLYDIEKLIYIDKDSKKKDIDGCFLSMPTNIIPFYEARKEIPKETLIQLLYSMEYLKANDQISSSMFMEAVRSIFYALPLNKTIGRNKSYKDINVGAMIILVQAIGRICRTGVKNKIVYIGYEPKVFECLERLRNNYKNYILNYECKEFLNQMIAHSKNSSQLPNDLTIANRETFCNIHKSLKWPWDYDKMIFWKKLREFVLRHPTASKEDFVGNRDFQKFYFKVSKPISCYSVDKYNFTSEFDFLVSEYANGLLEKRFNVSDRDCDLNALMKDDYFNQYFQRNAYATAFKENEYIMSPLLYHSVYKGALGEAIGKACLSKYGLELEEINDVNIFELFDYEASNIFLDFKKWSTYFHIDEEEQLKKVTNKMNTCQTEQAFIINVLKESYEDTFDDGIHYKDLEKNITTISWLYDVQKRKFNEIAIKSIIGKVTVSERDTHK